MATASATTFILGAGAVLSCSATSGGTFTPVNQLTKITFTAEKTDYIDITNLGSPSAAAGGPPVKESAPGTITPGTIAVTGFLAPLGDPGQLLVTGAFDAQTLLYWKLQFAAAVGQTTGAYRTFAAYVSEKPTMNPALNEAIGFDFSLQITGVVTDTPGATA